jgi:predicted DNA-binding transcriptional regulator AlpA
VLADAIGMQHTARTPRRILRQAAVLDLVPVHPTTIYRWEAQGKFPRRVVLGPNCIGWYADEIEAFLESLARQTGTGRPSPNPRAHRADSHNATA